VFTDGTIVGTAGTEIEVVDPPAGLDDDVDDLVVVGGIEILPGGFEVVVGREVDVVGCCPPSPLHPELVQV